MTTRLPKVLEHLRQAGGLTDGQLLARFVAGRDEASFATLLQRHGPMVLGVCRRVLGHVHDAEDAFQATFLVLARRAVAVVKRESVGSFLYGVAYRTALEACTANARRRAREKQVKDMPHPQVAPAEAPDWLPLLDRELSRLPEKYRAAIVLCELEGRPRKEAARLLAVPEGTLSSRLAAGRKLLAKRLLRQGLTLSGGALVGGTALAPVPAALGACTVQAAALVAAGQLTAVTPAVVLMKGVMKAMFLDKLKVLVGTFMVAAALGAVGFVCRPVGEARAQQPGDNKPVSEVEALRKEVELLKLNNKILLEKIGAQENELVALKSHTNSAVGPNFLYSTVGPNLNTTNLQSPYRLAPADSSGLNNREYLLYTHPLAAYQAAGRQNGVAPNDFLLNRNLNVLTNPQIGSDAIWIDNQVADPIQEIEAKTKALREAKDKDAQRKAAAELEKALKKYREQSK